MKPAVRIIRLEDSFDFGTFGCMKINDTLFCVTLEPPDLTNKKYISSIPEQQYTCKKIISSAYGETFQIMNVPGRTQVLFHPGNTKSNTQGCILLGQYWGKLKGDRAVLNSGQTFRTFMHLLDGYDCFKLTIEKKY